MLVIGRPSFLACNIMMAWLTGAGRTGGAARGLQLPSTAGYSTARTSVSAAAHEEITDQLVSLSLLL